MSSEKVINQLEDTVMHKKLVLDSCLMMSKYLISEGDEDISLDLLKRASTHDMSKFEVDELKNLSEIPPNEDVFQNPEVEMSDKETSLIELHWEHNSHHPEYFDDYSEMSKLDMLEMVCDWHARSIQHNTNFLSFVRKRQKTRFHFEQNQFEFIYKYCKIIDKIYKNGAS